MSKSYIKFKIEDLIVKRFVNIEDFKSDREIQKYSFELSEEFKIPYSKMLKVIDIQIKTLIKKNKENENKVNSNYKSSENMDKESGFNPNLSNLSNQNEKLEIENKLLVDKENLKESDSKIDVSILNNTNQSKIKIKKNYHTTKSFHFHNKFNTIQNIGERIFKKSLMEMNKRKINADRIRAEIDEKELKECKVRPVKSEHSTFLNFKLHYDLIPSERKREVKIPTKVDDTLVENTKIEKSKRNIDVNVTSDRLYRDWQKNNVKKQQLQDEYYKTNYPFKSPTSKSLDSSFKIDSEEFYKRMEVWKRKKEDKRINSVQKASMMNLTTGEILFKPNSNVPKQMFSFKDERMTENIFKRLYQDHKIIKEKKLEEEKNHEKHLSVLATFKIKDLVSKQIADSKDEKMIEKICTYLNPNSERFVTIDDEYINSLDLSEKYKKIFTPVLNQLKGKDGINQEELTEEIKKIVLNKLKYEDKSLITNWYNDINAHESPKKKRISMAIEEVSKKFSFKPTLSESNKEVLQSSKKYSNKNFSERVKDMIEKKSNYVSQKLLAKEKDELKEVYDRPNQHKLKGKEKVQVINEQVSHQEDSDKDDHDEHNM